MDSKREIYRVSAAGIDQLVFRRCVWIIILCVLFITLFVLVSGRSADQTIRLRLVVAGSTSIFAVFIGIFIASKWLEKQWSSYRLQFEENSILRLQKGLAPMRIDRSNVTKVEEVANYGLTIATKARFQRLFVPAGLVDYNGVRGIVGEWKTPQVISLATRVLRKSGWVGLGILYFALWLICIRCRIFSVVVESAFLFYLLTVVGLVVNQMNPNVTKSSKLLVWICILFQWKFLVFPFLRICSTLAR